MQARIRLDHSLPAAEGEHTVHALLELAAPDPPAAAERAPLALALVVDRSGSMAGEKLEVARRCADWLVGRLRATDELALVAYDDEVRVLAPLAPVRADELRARSA
ncbi:MAG: VWA domain-containing protein [Thermoleophilia bacterium]|nr:VWA domain-containing protein [Thermoleophilia bacterium]